MNKPLTLRDAVIALDDFTPDQQRRAFDALRRLAVDSVITVPPSDLDIALGLTGNGLVEMMFIPGEIALRRKPRAVRPVTEVEE